MAANSYAAAALFRFAAFAARLGRRRRGPQIWWECDVATKSCSRQTASCRFSIAASMNSMTLPQLEQTRWSWCSPLRQPLVAVLLLVQAHAPDEAALVEELERPVDRRAADLRAALAHADDEILGVEMPVRREDLVEEGRPLARDLQTLLASGTRRRPGVRRRIGSRGKEYAALLPGGNPLPNADRGRGKLATGFPRTPFRCCLFDALVVLEELDRVALRHLREARDSGSRSRSGCRRDSRAAFSYATKSPENQSRIFESVTVFAASSIVTLRFSATKPFIPSSSCSSSFSGSKATCGRRGQPFDAQFSAAWTRGSLKPSRTSLVLELLEVQLLAAEDDVHAHEEGVPRKEPALPDALFLGPAREDALEDLRVIGVQPVGELVVLRREQLGVRPRAGLLDGREEPVEVAAILQRARRNSRSRARRRTSRGPCPSPRTRTSRRRRARGRRAKGRARREADGGSVTGASFGGSGVEANRLAAYSGSHGLAGSFRPGA